jgi:hypothetical protein
MKMPGGSLSIQGACFVFRYKGCKLVTLTGNHPVMKELTTITDPVYVRPDRYTAFDKFLLSLIRDERDLPFVHVTLKISLIMVPLGILIYFVPFGTVLWWGLVVAYYYVNNFMFKGPFGLMLHCTSHRKCFKQKYQLLNHYLPWVISPFFGQSPETYYTPKIILKTTTAPQCSFNATASQTSCCIS